MSVFQAIAIRRGNSWWIKCPECGTRFRLEGCPEPGGMEYNAEFCPECSAEILINPPRERVKRH